MIVAVPPRIEPNGLVALHEALSALEDGDVAVLRGQEPPTFCLGMDLETYAHGDLLDLAEPLRLYGACLMALKVAKCPTVAVVEGPAMGGGFGLAAACDVVLISDHACFGLPEATFGLVPGMVIAAIADRVSPARLRRLALQGDSVGAREALEWGLADARLDSERTVSRWVRRLSRLAPGTVATVRHAVGNQFPDRVDAGRAITEGLLSRPDVQARVRRFMVDGTAPWEPLEETG